MSATVKFYTGVLIALALIVAASFALGYRAGAGHAAATHARAQR